MWDRLSAVNGDRSSRSSVRSVQPGDAGHQVELGGPHVPVRRRERPELPVKDPPMSGHADLVRESYSSTPTCVGVAVNTWLCSPGGIDVAPERSSR